LLIFLLQVLEPTLQYHDRRPGLNKVRQRGIWGDIPPAGVWEPPLGKGDPGAKPPEADAFL